jgi:formylglycine-generating enzyme required for sulfatase activity
MTMIEVPSGTFVMGDADSGLARLHNVTISQPFFVCDTEVRVDNFHLFIDDPDYPREKKPAKWGERDLKASPTGDYAVRRVSWVDAIFFCNWLSAREKRPACYRRLGDETWSCDTSASGYRLLTEAEWERACRAGTDTLFSFGNAPEALQEHGYFGKNSDLIARPVSRKLPNAFGLFDMHGNVAEWCWDWFGPYEGDAVDPRGPAHGKDRVLRGGGFHILAAEECNSGIRNRSKPGAENPYAGFRVACNASR